MTNMSYYRGKAALKYSLYIDELLAAKSDENTLSRLSLVYENGSDWLITSQLGFSFHYDLSKEDNYIALADGIRKEMYRIFDSHFGLFKISTVDDRKSELVNALAILSGVVNDEQALCIAEKLTDESLELIAASFAMRAIKYDALIKVDKDKYKDYILEEIDAVFEKMLKADATSFWETEDGTASCGSLCRGWSALTI